MLYAIIGVIALAIGIVLGVLIRNKQHTAQPESLFTFVSRYKGEVADTEIIDQPDAAYVDLQIDGQIIRRIFSHSQLQATGALRIGTPIEFTVYQLRHFLLVSIKKIGELPDWPTLPEEEGEFFGGYKPELDESNKS